MKSKLVEVSSVKFQQNLLEGYGMHGKVCVWLNVNQAFLWISVANLNYPATFSGSLRYQILRKSVPQSDAGIGLHKAFLLLCKELLIAFDGKHMNVIFLAHIYDEHLLL